MQFISLVPTFFTWWYGRGLKDLLGFLLAFFDYIKNMFSVGILLKTLFQPWKKMVSPKRPGLDGFKYWLVDNLISRGIGFIMRVIMMIIFCLAIFSFAVFTALALAFWLGMPAIPVFVFIYLFVGY